MLRSEAETRKSWIMPPRGKLKLSSLLMHSAVHRCELYGGWPGACESLLEKPATWFGEPSGSVNADQTVMSDERRAQGAIQNN